ncbi:MAG: hypothetical protein IT305_14390 [Chloroflexi bacterium]|nr:hypothetical protein [Chloroflexota bacterium]
MDPDSDNDLKADSPEETIQRTRKLLARSRATLDAAARRLAQSRRIEDASPDVDGE